MPIIKNYRMEARNFVYGEETVWATNWKCLAENFMEGYHLTPVHLKTLHPMTPTRLCKKVDGGAAWTATRERVGGRLLQRAGRCRTGGTATARPVAGCVADRCAGAAPVELR